MPHLSLSDAAALARAACIGAGASGEVATSLAQATVAAESRGLSTVGFSHLVDYLESFRDGRIDGMAQPEIVSPAPALIRSDARGGIAQLGFDRAFDDLCDRAATYGIALFAQHSSYTSGELGYYPRRLAERGLLAFAATNGPALMAAPGGSTAVYCTNPLAFAAPRAGQPPLVIDQASSATAFVAIREAAARGAAIPAGWAIDSAGRPTTDASEAMRGTLLTFGGARGGNIALMIEILAAGLGGANWSLDAPAFTTGNRSPGAGLTVIAIAPGLLDADFAARLAEHARRLAALGIHIPGNDKAARFEQARSAGLLLPEALVQRIAAFVTI